MAGLPPLSLTASSSAYAGPAIGGNLTFNNGSAALPNSSASGLNAGVYANGSSMSGYVMAGIALLFILALLKRGK